MRVSMTLFCCFPAVFLVGCSADAGSALSVSQILIGSEVNERQEIVVSKDQFAPSERTFYAHVFVEGLRGPAEITGAWWYTPQDRKIFETTVTVTPEFPVAKFVLSNSARDWVVGEYLFTVHYDGRELMSEGIVVANG